MPRILVLYNEPILPADHPDAESERDILLTVEVVAKTLAEAGMEVVRLGASHDPSVLVAGLQTNRPDVVFNLFEGTGDQADNEAYVAGILEWLGIPFTGCPHQTLSLARNKQLTKHLFQGAGLPTAPFSWPTDCRCRSPHSAGLGLSNPRCKMAASASTRAAWSRIIQNWRGGSPTCWTAIGNRSSSKNSFPAGN